MACRSPCEKPPSEEVPMKNRPMKLRAVLSLLILCVCGATSASTVTYIYDDAGRLINADYGNERSISYTYDANGNLLSRKVKVGPSIPGDCDGDGAVSIGEVQKAINQFLGIAQAGALGFAQAEAPVPPSCGVDCNGDGTVSIGEVQKVINGFLGLASSC
jgi:YD repeat-containing protein